MIYCCVDFCYFLQTISILLTGVGSALLIKGALPKWSFFSGGALLFIGTIILEGISMSLCSKVSQAQSKNVPLQLMFPTN